MAMKILILLAILSTGVAAQSCSPSNPCVAVTITVTDTSLVGASSSTLYSCMGGSAGCSLANLNNLIANPNTPNQWHLLGSSPQKSATITYNDPEPYGALMNYAAFNTPDGGSAGPVSPIWIFRLPNPPTPPKVSGTGVTTSGNAGPQ